MNETLKTIAERNSCRDFADTPLAEEQVKALVDAALASPSAMNRQPWHIIVVNDKALIDELDVECLGILGAADDKSGYDRIMSRGGKVYYNAPCMFLVLGDGSHYASMDSGIVSQSLALAAHSLGLGNVICGMAGIPFTGGRGDELKKRLGFPDGYSFEISVLVGTANSGKEPHALEPGKVSYI